MPIDKKKKFAFVHIPKCAGTSCGNFLKKYARYLQVDGKFLNNFYFL